VVRRLLCILRGVCRCGLFYRGMNIRVRGVSSSSIAGDELLVEEVVEGIVLLLLEGGLFVVFSGSMNGSHSSLLLSVVLVVFLVFGLQ